MASRDPATDFLLEELRELRRELRELREQRRAPEPEKAADSRTNLQLWDDWYPTVKGSARGPNIATHRAYCMLLEFEFRGTFPVTIGQLHPSQCIPEVMETWRAKLRTVVSKVRKKPLAPEYRHSIRMSMSAMWTYWMGVNVVEKHPLKGIPLEEGWRGRRRKGFSTKEKLDVFLPHCRPLLAAMHLLSFRSGGMRRDEMRLLRKQEIIWEKGIIKLDEIRNKNGVAREVILTKDDMTMLEHYCAISPSDYVFPNPNDPAGGPIPKSTLWGWQEEARQDAGAKATLNGEPWVMHSNRHGYVMDKLARKIPEAWIADQVGHKNSVMIDEVYGKMRTDEDRELFRAMAAKEKTPAPERKPPMHAPEPIVKRKGPSVGDGE